MIGLIGFAQVGTRRVCLSISRATTLRTLRISCTVSDWIDWLCPGGDAESLLKYISPYDATDAMYFVVLLVVGHSSVA